MDKIALAKHYKTQKALVIDDYPDIRSTIKRMIEKFGVVDVDVASNGEDAIMKCNKKDYDIILADYNLGEKKTGQQILEELRHSGVVGYHAIYVLITAETTRDKVYGAIENQPDAYLAKPFTAPALQSRLDALVKSRVELANIHKAADSGDFASAVKFCQQRIAKNDKYLVPCLKMQASFLYQLKEFKLAEQIYRKVIAERPLTWAQIGLARVLLAQGQLDEAEDILQALVSENCPFLETYDALAEIQAQRGLLFEAQNIIEKAVDMSPDSILRQQRLAEHAELNNDLERAEKAHKRVIKVGYHSVYEKPANYVDYAHCINQIVKDSGETDKKRFEEVEQVIGRLGRRYKSDPAVGIQTKFLMAESLVVQGKDEAAAKFFEEGQALYEASNDVELGADVTLEYAKALETQGQGEKAMELLKDLASKNGDNEDVLRSIDCCLGEPISAEGKKTVISFNKEGKALFDKNDFSGAVEFFAKALRIYPDHIALNLNMAMAILKALKGETKNKAGLKRRLDNVFQKLAGIEQDNKYFNLYSSLLKQAEAL